MAGTKSRISLVRTFDRPDGVKRSMALLGINPVKGKRVLLKPNFNTADPCPGSTDNETLETLVIELKSMGAEGITVGERSGPADTSAVIRQKNIHELAKKHGFEVLNFETMPDSDWKRISPEGSHWRKGFDFAKPALDAECVVSTCCLKTHGYGGVFTMSLKLSIGMVHKRNMSELHSSLLSMRKMIAEVNVPYSPSLIVLDGVDAFVDGGPMTGTLRRTGVFLAGTDRIAIDAVGLAVLKKIGSNRAVMERKIFSQEQIARAVELGLGAKGPEEIEIVAGDPESERYASEIRAILAKG